MSNLTNNTADLRDILAAVNALPEAGEGGITPPVVEPLTVRENGKTHTPPSGVDGFSTVTVDIPVVDQATPVIDVSAEGVITVTATQAEGYVEAGTKAPTLQMNTIGGGTITPSETEQTAVSAGTYVTGDIKVAAVETGGGSAVLETCTLTVDLTEVALDFSGGALYDHSLYFVRVVNGVPVSSSENLEPFKTHEFANCLKGSVAVTVVTDIGSFGDDDDNFNAEGDVERLDLSADNLMQLWSITGNATFRTYVG